MDRGHHLLQHRVEELARLLGIAVGQQLHGAFQVGEQHGDLLAFTFEGGLRGEDFLGQIPRGIPQRRWGMRSRRRWALRRERGAARTTELGAWERVRPILGAAGLEGVPHSMQNLTPSGVSTSQPRQRIDGLSSIVVRVAGAWMGKSAHTRLAATGLRCGVFGHDWCRLSGVARPALEPD
jgi:hypothetical protein